MKNFLPSRVSASANMIQAGRTRRTISAKRRPHTQGYAVRPGYEPQDVRTLGGEEEGYLNREMF